MFLTKFSNWKVIRSKTFQKMCIRASRNLSKSLNPGDKIFVFKNRTCSNIALKVILEPYTRKYGIEVINGENIEFAMDYKVDSIASALTLDGEVENIIIQMVNGNEIKLISSKKEFNELKIIYPLINIPESWINSWTRKYNLNCTTPPVNEVSDNLLKFFQEFIPEIRENMFNSALYVSKE